MIAYNQEKDTTLVTLGDGDTYIRTFKHKMSNSRLLAFKPISDGDEYGKFHTEHSRESGITIKNEIKRDFDVVLEFRTDEDILQMINYLSTMLEV